MKIRILVLLVFVILGIGSVFQLPQLKFTFDFEQFFPQGDKDLEYFREFVKAFETDDSFMLIAVKRENGAFDQKFLEQFHDFTIATRDLPHVLQSTSLTKLGYPIRTPFAITTIPAIHIDDPTQYASDSARLVNDERFKYNLISADGKTLVIFLKMADRMSFNQAKEFVNALDDLVVKYNFEEYHYMGRPYFQKELIELQMWEVGKSALISGTLVTLMLWFIYRRFWGVVVSVSSIMLGMVLFLGFMGILGREFNALSALYPVLMIIVGTSDVIHIMSKYVDELRKGQPRDQAMVITIKEIGLATLMTSATTAIGFLSLLTNRVTPIRDFGINAAIGVMIAYLTVIFFTTVFLSFFNADQITKIGSRQKNWDKAMLWIYHYTRLKPQQIVLGSAIALALSAWGISKITTNYEVINNLPRDGKITQDFRFFERELSGFRPMEFAGYIQNDYQANDFVVVKEIDKLETYLRQFPEIQAIGSVTVVYKTLNQMFGNNNPNAYRLPEDEDRFNQYRRFADQIPQMGMNVLVSEDGTKTRVTSRVKDIGADSIKSLGQRIERWMQANVDSSVIRFKLTGTGLLIDKNAEYVRRNLLQGVGFAILLIGGLMALLFLNLKMLVISLIPNLFPLIFGAAFLGFAGVELEAGISIIFSVIFGIAVDDSIHFLSKFKLAQQKGLSREEALRNTFLEAGKPIVLTTVLLFFGFLVMLFSSSPTTATVGWLISITLVTALVCDLLMLPVLIRWFLKE